MPSSPRKKAAPVPLDLFGEEWFQPDPQVKSPTGKTQTSSTPQTKAAAAPQRKADPSPKKTPTSTPLKPAPEAVLPPAPVSRQPIELPDDLATSRPVRVLEESWRKGRLPHGILLHGENLNIISQVAESLAARILQCPGRAIHHPDCFTLRPAKKARQIRISGEAGKSEPNTMRWFLRDIHQTSHQGGAKVGLIYEADRMNATVANAFLKTLEEPPPDTTLLLLTCRPYDLLTTIRSRCFNFRIPGEGESLQLPNWQQWLNDYSGWLQFIHQLRNEPAARAQAVFTAYALLAQFTSILAEAGDAAWVKEKDSLPENLSDEEIEALKAGVVRGVRNTLWVDIEKQTRDFSFARQLESPGSLPARHLARAIQHLEHCSTLNNVFNLKEESALEAFLLASLRIWPVR